MTAQELIAQLATVPPSSPIVIVWEDFAQSAIDYVEYDTEKGDFVIYHDMTGSIKEIEEAFGHGKE